ncbi:quinolinate synthase NadA, partial [Paenibacillus sp. 28ISP30-2]|nr:quinolinate synthase NadA [Paenibacillus sp. 28ISP30-2]
MSMLDVLQGNRGLMPEHYKTLTVADMEQRVAQLKQKWGQKLLIPGHHYQKDEVIQFADITGDSL